MLVNVLRAAYKESNGEEKFKKTTLEYFEPKLKEAVAAGLDGLTVRVDSDFPVLLKNNGQKMMNVLKAEGLSSSSDGETIRVWGWNKPSISEEHLWNQVVSDFLFDRSSRRRWC